MYKGGGHFVPLKAGCRKTYIKKGIQKNKRVKKRKNLRWTYGQTELYSKCSVVLKKNNRDMIRKYMKIIKLSYIQI